MAGESPEKQYHNYYKIRAPTPNEEEPNKEAEVYQNLQGPPPPVRSVSLPQEDNNDQKPSVSLPQEDNNDQKPSTVVQVEAHSHWKAPDLPLRPNRQQQPHLENLPRTPVDYHSINDQSDRMTRHNRKEEDRYTPSRIILQHVTTGAHVCTLLYTILVVYLCFSEEFRFFTWHPLLLSIGWCFLMTEGILALSKDNFLSGTLPKPTKVLWHWSIQGMSVLLLIGGFFVVYLNKSDLNKEHFKTWHGLLGLIATILAIVSVCGGIAASYGQTLRHYVPPKISKIIHVTLGIATYTIGGATLFLSVYSKWFQRNTENSDIVAKFAMAMVGITVVWTLVRPLMSLWERLRHCS